MIWPLGLTNRLRTNDEECLSISHHWMLQSHATVVPVSNQAFKSILNHNHQIQLESPEQLVEGAQEPVHDEQHTEPNSREIKTGTHLSSWWKALLLGPVHDEQHTQSQTQEIKTGTYLSSW